MSLRSVTLIVAMIVFFFFFSSRRRHTRWPRDWSSDVCSSDLLPANQCTNGIGIGSLRHQPRAKPMIEVACLILEQRSEERRVGKSVDLGGRRINKKKKKSREVQQYVEQKNNDARQSDDRERRS